MVISFKIPFVASSILALVDLLLELPVLVPVPGVTPPDLVFADAAVLSS